jgi:alpha-glucosidase
MWWERAVVYQIYPRSFQDADGDGLGDLPGATERLEYVASLGAQAVWLSPFYPSSDHDFGYDVSDFYAIDPRFGTFDEFDALLAEARRLGLRVLMDLVPCHTSIDHPWFRERPDFYVIRDTPAPPNNWRAAFGGSSWSRDPYGRGWYLHSFYPEQPDLDWRNPEVVAAMQDVVRFWLARGVDGLRLDALDRLMKDPELRDDPPATHP